MKRVVYHTMPLNLGDLARDTAHLTHDQFGVFMRLMMVHFSLGAKGIRAEDMPRYSRVTPKFWCNKYASVIEPLFVKRGSYRQLPRIVAMIQELEIRSATARANALKAKKTSDATALLDKDTLPQDKRQKEKENKESFLYEQFPGVQTAEEFFMHLPKKWHVIANSYGIEKELIKPVAMGFWERFVGRYPQDPLVQEQFLCKKNWEKAWEFECDRLDRVKRGLPKRTDLPMQHKKLLKGW